jgi:hypothetical protein
MKIPPQLPGNCDKNLPGGWKLRRSSPLNRNVK